MNALHITLEHTPLLLTTLGELKAWDVLKVYNNGFEKYVGADQGLELEWFPLGV